MQLEQLTSLAWLCGGALRPFHLWVPSANLQFGYADKFALLLPSPGSGCTRSLLHFLTARVTLSCAVLAVSVWQARTALPDGGPGFLRTSGGGGHIFPFLVLMLSGLVNLAFHFPAAARQAVARWEEAKTQEARESRKKELAGGPVEVSSHGTPTDHSRELRKQWMAWKQWKGREAARAAPELWALNVQSVLRK